MARASEILENLYRLTESEHRPATLQELSMSFHDICRSFHKVFVLIDGLDEREYLVRRRLMSAFNPASAENLALSMTSRPRVRLKTTYQKETSK